jgi:hypothetical protein
VSPFHGIQFSARLKLFALFAGIGLLAMAKNVRGQEALRISQAGDLAAAAQQQANSSIGYYNLLLGPTAWRFSSGLGLEFTDNYNLQQNKQSDFIIQPSLNTAMHWPVTQKNSLDISVGAGYSEYLEHSDNSQFFITPGSGLSFDVYVGDFKINLHDRVTITEYGYQNPGANGGGQNQVSLQNTIGASTLWDLEKVVVNFGYDHDNSTSLSSGQNTQPDSATENFFANGGVRVRPELLLGLEAGGTIINYSQNNATNALVTPNATQWSVGAFASAKVSEYIDVRLDAGYADYIPDSTSDTNLVTQNASGLYYSLSLSHRVNQHLNYTLSAGRSTDLSAYGQAQTYYFVSLSPNWNFLQKYTVSTPVAWRQGNSIYGTTTSGNGEYNQYQVGLNVGRSLTKKLSATFTYQFVVETSGQANLNYNVNIVGLNFAYQF